VGKVAIPQQCLRVTAQRRNLIELVDPMGVDMCNDNDVTLCYAVIRLAARQE
jgi:hypothetical protein